MGRSVKNFAINDQALTLGIPTTSTALRPAGQNGQMIYNTTTGTLQVYDNGWANISTSLSAGATITKDILPAGDGSTKIFLSFSNDGVYIKIIHFKRSYQN